jgi:hypothetical protein
MSSNTGAKVWSMGGRMASCWYAGSAAFLLVVATTVLYLTNAASLEALGDEYLGSWVEYLRKYQVRTGKLPIHVE